MHLKVEKCRIEYEKNQVINFYWHKNYISSYVSKAKLNVIRKRKSENGTAG